MKSLNKYLSGLSLFACAALASTNCNAQQTANNSTPEKEKAEMNNPATDSTETATTRATLSLQLAARAKASAAAAPAPMLKAFKEGIELAEAMGLEKSAKQVGDMAVDGTLTGWSGDAVTLSKLWNEAF